LLNNSSQPLPHTGGVFLRHQWRGRRGLYRNLRGWSICCLWQAAVLVARFVKVAEMALGVADCGCVDRT
jgi:hypothetical protein